MNPEIKLEIHEKVIAIIRCTRIGVVCPFSDMGEIKGDKLVNMVRLAGMSRYIAHQLLYAPRV